MRFLCLILFILPFSFSVHADPYSGGRSSFSKIFYFSVAAKGGLGKGGSYDGESMETRDLYVFGGEATLGFFISGIMVGGSAEYNLWKQKSEPEDVAGSNISGKQTTFSPVIGIPLGPCLFQLKYPLSSKYKMDNESSTGEAVEYSDAKIPFSLMLAYSLGKTFIGVEYTKIEYKNVTLDGEESTVVRDDRLTLSSFTLVYGLKF